MPRIVQFFLTLDWAYLPQALAFCLTEYISIFGHFWDEEKVLYTYFHYFNLLYQTNMNLVPVVSFKLDKKGLVFILLGL